MDIAKIKQVLSYAKSKHYFDKGYFTVDRRTKEEKLNEDILTTEEYNEIVYKAVKEYLCKKESEVING